MRRNVWAFGFRWMLMGVRSSLRPSLGFEQGTLEPISNHPDLSLARECSGIRPSLKFGQKYARVFGPCCNSEKSKLGPSTLAVIQTKLGLCLLPLLYFGQNHPRALVPRFNSDKSTLGPSALDLFRTKVRLGPSTLAINRTKVHSGPRSTLEFRKKYAWAFGLR